VLCVDITNASVMSELRHHLVRLGVIKAARVVLPRQQLLRHILMSAAAAGDDAVQLSDSHADIAAADAASVDTAPATDTQPQVVS